uniref:Uncharacterized protein n=1 Tax=Pavo cristatus TaxID=9049 RepID=A0A8C9FUY4_PAVCR
MPPRNPPALQLRCTSHIQGWGGGGGRQTPSHSSDPPLCVPPPPQESLFASQERFFQELFDGELASQASAEFERAMKELAEEEPHLVEQFQKLSEAAGRVGLPPQMGLQTPPSGARNPYRGLGHPCEAEEPLCRAGTPYRAAPPPPSAKG